MSDTLYGTADSSSSAAFSAAAAPTAGYQNAAADPLAATQSSEIEEIEEKKSLLLESASGAAAAAAAAGEGAAGSADGAATSATAKPKSLNWTIPSFAAFVLLGAIWGSAFLAIKVAVDDKHGFPPFTLVTLRMCGAAVLMIMMLLLNLLISKDLRQGVKKNFNASTFVRMCTMGFFNNFVPFVTVAYAEMYINSGVASILDATIPLFSLLFAHFALKGEKITLLKFIGLSIGFAGVVLVCLQKVYDPDKQADGLNFEWQDWLGFGLVTIASMSYAIASVFARRFMTHLPGMFASTGQNVSAAIMCALCMLVVDMRLPHEVRYDFFVNANWQAWVSIVYLAVFSTVVAYLLYFYLIRTVGSVKQTMVGFLLPVFGVFEGALLLGEWSGVRWWYIVLELIGAVLIVIGVAIVSVPRKAAKSSGDAEGQTKKKKKRLFRSSRGEEEQELEVDEGNAINVKSDESQEDVKASANGASAEQEWPEVEVAPVGSNSEKQSLLKQQETRYYTN